RALVDAAPAEPGRGRKLAGAFANVAWASLFTGDLDGSEAASREALALVPGEAVFLTRLAHALMLAGRIAEADAIYLGRRGTMVGDRSWEDVIVTDFAALRADGVSHPHMAEIEQTFSETDAVRDESAAAD
ncbi:MAG: hypothetical protein RLO48_12710, partial [Bauldia litoralis]